MVFLTSNLYLIQKETHVIILLPLKAFVTIVLRELRRYLLNLKYQKSHLKNTRIKKLKSKSRTFFHFGSNRDITTMTIHNLAAHAEPDP